jgi:hypothetical protein
MKFGVVVFPGSNCDHDAYHVVSKHVGQPVNFIWHKETDLSGYDAVLIPGGFSYGDYLRAGALARFSPVIRGRRQVRVRDMQRVSDPLRKRFAPGGIDPKRRPSFCLPARQHSRREQQHAVHL